MKRVPILFSIFLIFCGCKTPTPNDSEAKHATLTNEGIWEYTVTISEEFYNDVNLREVNGVKKTTLPVFSGIPRTTSYLTFMLDKDSLTISTPISDNRIYIERNSVPKFEQYFGKIIKKNNERSYHNSWPTEYSSIDLQSLDKVTLSSEVTGSAGRALIELISRPRDNWAEVNLIYIH